MERYVWKLWTNELIWNVSSWGDSVFNFEVWTFEGLFAREENSHLKQYSWSNNWFMFHKVTTICFLYAGAVSGGCAQKIGPLKGNFIPIILRLPFRFPYSQWMSTRLWEGRRGRLSLLEKLRLQSSLHCSQPQEEFLGRPLGMFLKLPGEWLKAPLVPGHLKKKGKSACCGSFSGASTCQAVPYSAYEESWVTTWIGT